MASTHLKKVETIMFQISQEDSAGMELLWKDGSLYLSLSKLMIDDGNIWYAIPFEELRDIEAGDDGGITFKIEGANLRIRGESAERLMALRHLLLPLIERKTEDGELIGELVKLLLLGIKDREIIASLLKRDVRTISALIKEAEEKGYTAGMSVTEKGKSLLSAEEKEMIEKAGVST